MKKICTSWNSRSLNKDKFCRPCSNTEIPHLGGMEFPQLRSTMATLPKTPFLPIIVHFSNNGNRKWKNLKGKLMPRKNLAPPTITLMLIPSQKLKMALTWSSKILAPNSGTFMVPSLMFHRTGDITSRLSVAVCWFATADSYGEEFLLLYHRHHTTQCKTLLQTSLHHPATPHG